MAGGTTRLLARSVKDNVAAQYFKPLKELSLDCKLNDPSIKSGFELGIALATYLDCLWFAKLRNISHGSKLLSAVHMLYPESKDKTPLSDRSLISWSPLANLAEGGPLPVEFINSVAFAAIKKGFVDTALVRRTSYDGYLREQDWSQLRHVDIHVNGNQVSYTCGESERGERAKTGANQGVCVESPFMVQILIMLKNMTRRGGPIFPIAAATYRKQWWESLISVSDHPDLQGAPHKIRHSRPSHEILNQEKSLEEVRRRGRWISLKSVQSYTKSFLLVKAKAAFTREMTDLHLKFENNRMKVFCSALTNSSIAHTPLVLRSVEHFAQGALRLPTRLAKAPLQAEQSLEQYKVHELRQLCRNRGLEDKGVKKVLWERLSRAANAET